MKLATLNVDGLARVACNVDAGESLAGGWLLAPETLGDTVDIITAGAPALDTLRALTADATPRVAASRATYLAPIRRFRRDVLCTGWNY